MLCSTQQGSCCPRFMTITSYNTVLAAVNLRTPCSFKYNDSFIVFRLSHIVEVNVNERKKTGC